MAAAVYATPPRVNMAGSIVPWELDSMTLMARSKRGS